MFHSPKSRRVRFSTIGVSLTQQSSKDECDIHIIMRKAEKHGIVTHLNKYAGTYSDMVSAPNYHEAMVLLANANSMFESVPSSIRAKFGNDPARFLDFMQNENNRDKILKMGLDVSHLPKPSPAAPAAPAVPPATTPAVTP